MRKRSINLQELSEKIYLKAKAEPKWRFWGLFTHVCKVETLKKAYMLVKKNNGSPGADGITFEEIETTIGVDNYVLEILQELLKGDYRPVEYRQVNIPKADGKERILKIPAIRDRIVQGALKLILEPIFEADFQEGSYGFRPKRRAHDALSQIDKAIYQGKTIVIDLDLSAYFDNIRHDILFEKVAERINDPDIMHLLKVICKAAGKKGVPQGGVLSPLLANVYLNEVDKMLEKATRVTRQITYARYADDIVVLVKPGHWVDKVHKRLLEELDKIQVSVNEEKSKIVNLEKSGSFTFLGFEYRRIKGKNGKYRPDRKPSKKAKEALLDKLRALFKRYRSQPVQWVVTYANPILRGWLNYFRTGNSTRTFAYVRMWLDKKLRRHMRKSRQKRGFGWKKWSRRELVRITGIYDDYRIRYYRPKATPVR